jgi:hypothetical protein
MQEVIGETLSPKDGMMRLYQLRKVIQEDLSSQSPLEA